jgi:integrase
MSTKNITKTSDFNITTSSDRGGISTQKGTHAKVKSGKQVANQIPRSFGAVGGKMSPFFWAARVFKAKNDRGEESPYYSMKVQFKGRRFAFTLRTSNKDIAGKLAAGIYNDLLTLGIEETLKKHRPQTTKAEDVATVGKFLEAARAVMAVRASTFAGYAVSLRRVAGDILAKRPSRKARLAVKRASKKVVDGASLEILTARAVQEWRLGYVAKAGKDAAKARAARISANSVIRQAKSLFGPKVVKFLPSLRLPDPLPFAGVEMFPRESMRYHSKIDAGEIMRAARDELAESQPELFLVLLLAVACGLRRGEIDSLTWGDVDLKQGKIHVDFSEHGALKSEDSRGAVDMDATTAEILQGLRAKAEAEDGDFVIPAMKAAPGEKSRAWGNRYRGTTAFEKASAWLRAHGVNANKPIHTLRKEAGSIIATRDGIFAASAFLRHSDISVTARYYADKKTRTTIDMAALLAPVPEPVPENVVPLPKAKQAERPKGKRKAG